MLCAGSHVMFPGLFILLLRGSVRLLRRKSVSGLRSTEVMQRSLWMRRRGCICIIRSAADGSGCGGGIFLRILFTGGKNLWSMVCLRSSSMDRSIILWSLRVFHRCWKTLLCDKEYADAYPSEVFGSEEDRADCAGA